MGSLYIGELKTQDSEFKALEEKIKWQSGHLWKSTKVFKQTSLGREAEGKYLCSLPSHVVGTMFI